MEWDKKRNKKDLSQLCQRFSYEVACEKLSFIPEYLTSMISTLILGFYLVASRIQSNFIQTLSQLFLLT